jgi:hypothetical protein
MWKTVMKKFDIYLAIIFHDVSWVYHHVDVKNITDVSGKVAEVCGL